MDAKTERTPVYATATRTPVLATAKRTPVTVPLDGPLSVPFLVLLPYIIDPMDLPLDILYSCCDARALETS